jgi:hypothetical protein
MIYDDTAKRIKVEFTEREFAQYQQDKADAAKQRKRVAARNRRRSRPFEAEDATRRERAGRASDLVALSDDPHAFLAVLAERRKVLDEMTQLAASAARADGVSWRRIGEALGIPGTTAESRYDRVAPRALDLLERDSDALADLLAKISPEEA